MHLFYIIVWFFQVGDAELEKKEVVEKKKEKQGCGLEETWSFLF